MSTRTAQQGKAKQNKAKQNETKPRLVKKKKKECTIFYVVIANFWQKNDLLVNDYEERGILTH